VIKLKKTGNLLLALLLAFSVSSYAFIGHAAATAGILGSRQIKMASSQASGTNVKYSFSFSVGSTNPTIGGFVAAFCSDSPIPGDTCTAPTGFNTCFNGATGGCAVTLAISNMGGTCGITSGWSIDTASNHSTASRVELTRTAGAVTTNCTITFDLTGFTNPSATNTTFYARMFTYAGTGAAYTDADPGTHIDDGGVALSTTAQLTITAKVQEQLTLCIYTGANCGAGGTAVTLGNNGVLDVSHSYTNVTAKFQASTNAASGMTVYAQGNTLTSPQSFTIAAINSGAATAAASAAGTEQFGFCVAVSGGSVTASAPYNNGSCSSVTNGQDAAGSAQFAFDTTSTPNMTSSGGDIIASSTGPSSTTTGTLAYLANIAPTTKAGIYTTTQTFIGVGTF
jgi:hypothetical protein